MSYVKQTWQTGDTVTSAKLNHMEGGIAAGGGVLVVGLDSTTRALDKTWREIFNADFAVFVYAGEDDKKYYYITALRYEDGYLVEGAAIEHDGSITPATFLADSADGYPVMQTG